MLRAHFFARSGRFALDPRPPDSMLEAETRGFSMFFDACTQPLCTLSEINKTLRWRTKIEVQAFRARIEKRRKINAIAVRAHECVQRGLRDGPRRCLERPGLPIWCPRRPTWRPRRPTWRPKRPNLASRARAERVSACLQSDPERPKVAETDFSSFSIDFSQFFRRFLARFFVDFRASRVRRRHKSRISKRSRVILSARLGSCVVQSLRTARTSFEMIFEHCMFSLFSLRTHKLT